MNGEKPQTPVLKPEQDTARRGAGLARFVFLGLGLLCLVAAAVSYALCHSPGKVNLITAANLERTTNIAGLSTAEFVYNGIAESYDGENEPEQTPACYIRYEATVKIGIEMDAVDYVVDEAHKKIFIRLPEVKIISKPCVDPASLGYMQAGAVISIFGNPSSVGIKNALAICEQDVAEEAAETKELFTLAEENARLAIEGLLTPLISNTAYVIVWENDA